MTRPPCLVDPARSRRRARRSMVSSSSGPGAARPPAACSPTQVVGHAEQERPVRLVGDLVPEAIEDDASLGSRRCRDSPGNIARSAVRRPWNRPARADGWHRSRRVVAVEASVDGSATGQRRRRARPVRRDASRRSQRSTAARTQLAPRVFRSRSVHGEFRMQRAAASQASSGRDPAARGSMLQPRKPDQYWSALMISPPARVTRAAMNWTDATSLMKWTEPSTNRALAPPVWNE